MKSTPLKNSTDEDLISLIKTGKKGEDALKEIIKRHSGIYVSMVNIYAQSSSPLSNKSEFLHDKDYNIYQAALKYDSSRGAKFSTYLGNETKWKCLNSISKSARCPETSCENMVLELNQEKTNCEHKKNLDKELISAIIDIVEKNPDDRVYKIFKLRYLEGYKNKVMPWKKVSSQLSLSIQGCINIHDSAISKIKNKLKEI